MSGERISVVVPVYFNAAAPSSLACESLTKDV
jgi:hypothetical protein